MARWKDKSLAALTGTEKIPLTQGTVDYNTTPAALAALIFANAALTGVPTAPTAAPGTNTNQIATMAALKAAIDALIDTAPGALDTLNELSAALGDDADFAGTMTAALAGKIATALIGAASGIAPLNSAARLDPIYRAKKRVTVAPVAGVLTLDLATLDDAYIALTANVSSTVVTNGPPSGYAREGTLIFVQDATGSRTWAPPAGAKWPNGLAAVLTATANAVDHIGYRVYNNAGVLEYTFYPVRDVR